MTAMWVTLITHSRIISNQQYIPCSLYQTCLVCDSGYILPIGRVVKPTVGVWKGVMEGRGEVMAGEAWEKEWVEGGKELWEVIERFLEERGI